MITYKTLNWRTFEHLIDGTASPYYMSLGRPSFDGGLRGSMLVEFKSEFLLRRLSSVDYWSPLDVGGVENGYSRLPTTWGARLKLPLQSLTTLLAVARNNVKVRDAILNHRPMSQIEDVMPMNMLNRVIAMASVEEWIYEVKLLWCSPCRSDEVARLIVPNTALRAARRRLSTEFKDIFVPYNPALGHGGMR